MRYFTTEWIDGIYTPIMLPITTGEHEVTLHWFDVASKGIHKFEAMIHDPPTKAQLQKYKRNEDLSLRSLVNAVSVSFSG
jgi:hypothetical protein